jgi:hypothetical protein
MDRSADSEGADPGTLRSLGRTRSSSVEALFRKPTSLSQEVFRN